MTEDSNTQRAIGRLEGQMREVINLLKSQDERSSSSRARLYEAQEKTAREVHDLGRRMESVETSVGIMDPLVKELARIKERSVGILMVLGFVWLILGGLILQGISWIAGIVSRAVGGGP